MRFVAKDYGPQTHVDIKLGDLVTLFVGLNNTGKTFVSRAIYAILKSCRGGKCDVNRLATLLLNTSIASKQDLCFVSREFHGKFSLLLEDKDLKFRVRIDYDESRHNPLITEMSGKVPPLSSLYVPAYRVISLGLLYMFAGYAVELKDMMLKLASQITTAFGSTEKRELPIPQISSTGLDSDLLHVLVRSLLSTLKPILEQRQDTLEAVVTTLLPTLLDLATAMGVVRKVGVKDHIKNMFKDLFPEFPYRVPWWSHGVKVKAREIPSYLLSSGIMQSLPILCLLNLALIHIEQGYKKVLIFIDEPELNLELMRQIKFSETLMDLVYTLHKEGKSISLIIATHSDFVAYSITKWLARKNLRNLAKVYEFKYDGVEEREIDEHGEVKLKTFSEAVRKMFFEEEFIEE